MKIGIIFSFNADPATRNAQQYLLGSFKILGHSLSEVPRRQIIKGRHGQQLYCIEQCFPAAIRGGGLTKFNGVARDIRPHDSEQRMNGR
jgi:hypothetical protein